MMSNGCGKLDKGLHMLFNFPQILLFFMKIHSFMNNENSYHYFKLVIFTYHYENLIAYQWLDIKLYRREYV